MIPKEELFLGAWVCVPELIYDNGPDDYNLGYVQITKLEDDCVWTTGLNEIDYSEIDPILLTPEIVERYDLAEYLDVVLFDSKENYKGAATLEYFHELQYLMKMIHGREIEP